MRKFLLWKAFAEPTEPICVGVTDKKNDGWSITLWTENDQPVGALLHEYKNGAIVKVSGTGKIPAEYSAYEQNSQV